MKIASRHPRLLWMALLMSSAVTLQGCQDFLEDAAAPQGTLNDLSLATRAGVEGNLIATYRALDWNNGVGGAWGNAASIRHRPAFAAARRQLCAWLERISHRRTHWRHKRAPRGPALC